MAEPTRNLDSIPYDVFYEIASGLDCHDFVNLSRVNRTLYGIMRDESLARTTIEVSPTSSSPFSQLSSLPSGPRIANTFLTTSCL